MKKQPFPSSKTPDPSRLDRVQLLLLVRQMQQQIDAKDQLLSSKDTLIASKDNLIANKDTLIANKDTLLESQAIQLTDKNAIIKHAHTRIRLLEETIRLLEMRKFTASSEKNPLQLELFDEAELEVELGNALDTLPEEQNEAPELKQMRKERKIRNRAFSASLPRKRIELLLSDAEKQGASRIFFSKIKEELDYIPAQLIVLEYWQEKAVFEHSDLSEQVLAAARPLHPLGKCQASLSLITQVILGKYADSLPLYRQEAIFKRLGHELYRGTMARWMLDLLPVITPLLRLYRDTQKSAAYLQVDETRIQVLKESGKTAQSDKWMWVSRGGPPGQQSVLFEYDPSRSGDVALRLLDGFTGILQADGYVG